MKNNTQTNIQIQTHIHIDNIIRDRQIIVCDTKLQDNLRISEGEKGET